MAETLNIKTRRVETGTELNQIAQQGTALTLLHVYRYMYMWTYD